MIVFATCLLPLFLFIAWLFQQPIRFYVRFAPWETGYISKDCLLIHFPNTFPCANSVWHIKQLKLTRISSTQLLVYELKVILFDYGSTAKALGHTHALATQSQAGFTSTEEQPCNLKGNSLFSLCSINHIVSLAKQSGFNLALIYKCPYLKQKCSNNL